jgi:hypothetical protein
LYIRDIWFQKSPDVAPPPPSIKSSKPVYVYVRTFSVLRLYLKRLRSTIDQSTARIIATALIHSKLDYCNSLLLNLRASHLNRLQLVLNSAARAVTRTSNFRHISRIFKDLL